MATEAVMINVPAVHVFVTSVLPLGEAVSVPVAPDVPENVAVPVPAPMLNVTVSALESVTVFVAATARVALVVDT